MLYHPLWFDWDVGPYRGFPVDLGKGQLQTFREVMGRAPQPWHQNRSRERDTDPDVKVDPAGTFALKGMVTWIIVTSSGRRAALYLDFPCFQLTEPRTEIFGATYGKDAHHVSYVQNRRLLFISARARLPLG